MPESPQKDHVLSKRLNKILEMRFQNDQVKSQQIKIKPNTKIILGHIGSPKTTVDVLQREHDTGPP